MAKGTILDRKYTALPTGVSLNEMQEMIVPHMDKEYNLLVSAPTASGKSTAMYMLGNKWLEKGKRIVYIGIMRALAQEKSDDLNEYGHPWGKYKHTVISGDYRMDADKQREVDAAQIICITPEALASRMRHPKSEKNKWMSEIGLLVIDEIHLLTQEDRGTNMEAALIEFTHVFPETQLLGLSATVPNAQHISDWMTKLNGKHTHMIVSTYRPVPLRKHYLDYDPGDSREESEDARIDHILRLLMEKPDQQFLIGVWHKQFGEKIAKALWDELEIRADFHNANKTKDDKKLIEQRFKTGINRVLISTSTLFTGVNLPARNVIITAVEAAKQNISAFELLQAAGRAGRPRYDTEGDAYFLIPDSRMTIHVNRIENGELVISQMDKTNWLATHFLGAMYVGHIHNFDTFSKWFDRTLAQHQKDYSADKKQSMLSNVLSDMVRRGMVRVDEAKETFTLTRRGIICAQMYLDPYHFSDLLMNLQKYTGLTRPTDHDLANAIGRCSGFLSHSVTNNEMASIQQMVKDDKSIPREYLKAVSVVLYRIQGDGNGIKGNIPGTLSNVNFQIWEDIPRLHAAVMRAFAECERWDISEDRLDVIFTRVMKKLNEKDAELAIGRFTKGERRKLQAIGLYSIADVKDNPYQAATVLSDERLRELGMIGASGEIKQRAVGFGKGRGFQKR
jgi:replicative superfamily II helicase